MIKKMIFFKQVLSLTVLLSIIVSLHAQQELSVVPIQKQTKFINNLDSVIQIYTLRNVYFDFGSKTIRNDDVENLKEIVLLLKNNPELKLEIVGHVDNKEVKGLSVERAQEVFEWFINQGIEKRITYKSVGNIYPILSNNNPEYRQINRRVEFKITK